MSEEERLADFKAKFHKIYEETIGSIKPGSAEEGWIEMNGTSDVLTAALAYCVENNMTIEEYIKQSSRIVDVLNTMPIRMSESEVKQLLQFKEACAIAFAQPTEKQPEYCI